MNIPSIPNIVPGLPEAIQKSSTADTKASLPNRVADVEEARAEPALQEKPSPSAKEVEQAVKSINKALQERVQDLEFSIDTDSNRTIVKVIDQSTKEVLRQIPNEETLAIAKALDQVTGLLIRQKA